MDKDSRSKLGDPDHCPRLTLLEHARILAEAQIKTKAAESRSPRAQSFARNANQLPINCAIVQSRASHDELIQQEPWLKRDFEENQEDHFKTRARKTSLNTGASSCTT